MIVRTHVAAGTESHAVYSPCDRYRYSLTRTWDIAAPQWLFVMLNPSTATEARNDPTVERCERRARAAGAGGFAVANIFAFRATDPRAMRAEADPVGPGNDAALRGAADRADLILCAWGGHGAHLSRGRAVAAMLRATGRPLLHLGLTAGGEPRHPLYVGYAVTPQPWEQER